VSRRRRRRRGGAWLALLVMAAAGLYLWNEGYLGAAPRATLNALPDYSGKPYVELDGNEPSFADADFTQTSWETYSPLDVLGRCGAAYANVGRDLMPTEKRGDIGQIRPSGWQIATYDFVDGRYLYNRCHLIGYQLSGENANERNLITGTRYLNVEGMLPFENLVADYVRETGDHVLYRVTPVFRGTELVARGVEMEAESVGDRGKSVSFHVFCYNVQPRVTIDYATGDNRLSGSS
jgi:DNA-entry nuclease